jgi:hypothetical protein
LLDDYLKKALLPYLTIFQDRLRKFNLNEQKPYRYFLGSNLGLTLADLDNAHIAHSYLLNEHNKFYDEQSALVKQEGFKDLLDYYTLLKSETLKSYFEN